MNLSNVLTFILATFFSVNLLAVEEKVITSFEYTQNDKTYVSSDVENFEYQQVGSLSRGKSSIEGTGLLAALNQVNEIEDTQVPGVDSEGYSKLSLKNINGQFYLVVDAKVYLDEIGVELPIQYSAEAVFTKGNWTDYQNGKDVEMELTGEGQEVATEAVAARLKYSMKKLREQLSADTEVGEIVVEKFQTKGRSKIKLNLSRMQITGAKVKGSISFTVEL